jgi:ACT domain-containing protein
MMMMVSLSSGHQNLEVIKAELSAMGNALGVSISLMHEQVFSAMHRI